MNVFREKIERIKNPPKYRIEKDFVFNTFSFFMLLIGGIATLGTQYALNVDVQPEKMSGLALCYLIAGVVIALLSVWSIVIIVLFAAIAALVSVYGIFEPLVYGVFTASILIATSVQLVFHWDKVIILRGGRFKKVRDAGLFMIIPVIDRIADFVDTRIRVTDFSAEKTLTRDNVPVHIDAICFWMIWDAKKAILEVQNYVEAVTLSAQTALRDCIGSNDLSTLLSERDKVGKALQQILDTKTNPWGITILSVEFTDVIIPKELEDAMSRKAQAEREKQARVILSSAETEAAEKFAEAAKKYQGDPVALNLRAMNIVYDGLKNNKGSLMLLPSSALDSMNLGSVLGTAAYEKITEKGAEKKEEEQRED